MKSDPVAMRTRADLIDAWEKFEFGDKIVPDALDYAGTALMLRNAADDLEMKKSRASLLTRLPESEDRDCSR